jgi:hypothetical protein
VESPAHATQGALPVPENDVPPTQGAIVPLQTMSEPGMQAVWTPAEPHVESSAQDVHGAFPEAEKVLPAAHATWHTVSDVLVQAVLTPAVHVASAAHTVHGAFPEVEKVLPSTHATWHTVFVVVVQAVLTLAVHVASAAHTVHGALPEVEKVEPVVHGRHALSAEIVAGVKPSPATHVLMFTVPHASPLALAE